MPNKINFKLLPLLLVIVIDTMGFGLIIPVLSPLFMLKTGGILPPEASLFTRDFLYSFALGGFSLLMLFGAPVLGNLSDYVGRKKVLIICLLGTGVSLGISGLGILVHSVALLLFGRCVAGFVAGSQPIAQAAIADVSSAENKAANIGLMIFASCIGFILGPIIGGYFTNTHLVSWFNYSTPFFVATLLALLNVVGVIIAFKETYHPPPNKKLEITKGFGVIITGFTDPKIRWLVISLLFMQLGFATYFTFVGMFVVQVYHFSALNVGHLMTYFGLIFAFAFLFVIRIVIKRFKLKTLVIAGLVLMTASILCVLWPAEWVIWITAIPIGISNGLTYTGMITLLSNTAGPESQGWIMGVGSAVIAIAWSVGSLIAGSVGAFHFYLPFVVAALLSFLSLVVITLKQNRI